MRIKIAAALTALALGLMACTAMGGAELEGGIWQIEDINGAGIVDASRVEIAFDGDGRLSGTGGCNRFFAGYESDGTSLTIATEMGMTMMACPEALMRQDRTLSEALGSVDSYEIDETGALRLISAGETVVLARR